MSPLLLTFLLLNLGLGTTITFASSHWLLAWMGLEINTLAILPLMTRHNHPRAVEATIKYFLIQIAAAAMILFAGMTNASLTGQWDILQLTHPLSALMMTLALVMKIGLAPMHMWFPEVLQGVDLTTGLILSTWQKLAPFILLIQIKPDNTTLLVTVALMSIAVGGWAGLNQTQLRKILAYSSIAHIGWIVLATHFSLTITLLALSLYLLISTSIFLLFKLNKATNINTLAISWTKAPLLTTLAPLILLSLGGLPPLTGFMPKWLIIQELTKQGLAPAATLAALTALLSLYFYLRLSYAMTLTTSPNNTNGLTPWRRPSNQHTLPLAITTTTAILLLPLTPTMITLFS
uniref:NADH-ubiquinone oxidoreductase chain 2 n=2 Tax=Parachanna TaxID=215403 RepID=Q18PP4_9TELE|nr:NADH dehydrogenase subunit 2 [Parachanna insignis]BAE96247.1 NADH dehydrogenase subunit 2 [Parachanna obscura]BAN83335.1 NADH dehydrogenase subunit 2 [Parachanna insignis]BCD33203.1 NADH dehydrogenase subunit 2 [Parachanna obscura]